MMDLSINPCIISYGVKLCFIMGPGEFSFIYSSSDPKLEPSWDTSSKCRKKQSRTPSPEGPVLQKSSIVPMDVTSCPCVLTSCYQIFTLKIMSVFQDFSKQSISDWIWNIMSVASMCGGRESDFVGFSIGRN